MDTVKTEHVQDELSQIIELNLDDSKKESNTDILIQQILNNSSISSSVNASVNASVSSSINASTTQQVISDAPSNPPTINTTNVIEQKTATIEQKTPEIDSSLLFQYLEKNRYIQMFDKIAGIIYGCALGDCVGILLEGMQFIDFQNLQKPPATGIPTQDFRNIHKGDWSDDTDQMILLMEILTEKKLSLTVKAVAEKFYKWNKHGFEELGDPNGVGIDQYTRHVLQTQGYEETPFEVVSDIHSQRNYSTPINSCLPRSGIVAFHSSWMRYTLFHCIATHVDARCVYSTWMLAAICRCLMKGIIPTDKYLFDAADGFIKTTALKKEFDHYKKIFTGPTQLFLSSLQLGEETDMRHVYKTLGAGYYMLRLIREATELKSTLSFKKVILDIVNQCGDTDTNAAVAGQIYGAYYGYSALPVEWLNKLINKPWLDKKIIKFFDVLST